MSAGEQLLDRIENADALDRAAAPAATFWAAVLKPAWLRDVLSGKQLGHPLHPAAVLVPAGTLLSATALDLTGGPGARPAARRLIGLGLLASLPTVAAGWSDWLDTEQAEKRVGLVHAATNALGVGVYAASWWQRRRGGSGVGTSLVGAAVLGAGGWLGGHLAYAQGVGVDTTAFQAGPSDWTDVAAAADVTEEFQQVRAGDIAVLLTRVDGHVVALADRCTHRGAALSEGDRDGACVVCPWHGSSFALTTGAVRRGPATRPQPSYEVRETGGRIEIRRTEVRALRSNPV